MQLHSELHQAQFLIACCQRTPEQLRVPFNLGAKIKSDIFMTLNRINSVALWRLLSIV